MADSTKTSLRDFQRGDRVIVLSGKPGEWTGTVVEIGRKYLHVRRTSKAIENVYPENCRHAE